MSAYALEGILEADPTDTRAVRELGAVYEDAGDIDRALEYYRKALSLTFDEEAAPEQETPSDQTDAPEPESPLDKADAGAPKLSSDQTDESEPASP